MLTKTPCKIIEISGYITAKFNYMHLDISFAIRRWKSLVLWSIQFTKPK